VRRHWFLAAAVAAVLALSSNATRAQDNPPAAAVNAEISAEKYLIPGGKSLGIAIETEGLVVVGTSDLGVNASPARLAGLTSGDIITEINHARVREPQELAGLLKAGETADVQVVRGTETKVMQLTPATDPRDGSARIGAWVRSSTAGVGTLTYVDPETGSFAALGHPIADVDRCAMVGAVIGVQVVVDGGQHHPVADQCVVPDVDAALILKIAAGIDEHVLSQVNVPPEVCIEGRKHGHAVIYRLARQLRHDFYDFSLRVVLRVQLHGLANGVLALPK